MNPEPACSSPGCCRTPTPVAPAPHHRGVEHAGVIDLLAEDPATGAVTLGMEEPRPWDGSDRRLFQLQEKLNATLSFALDGEMAEAYPALRDRPLRLRLDCATAPDPRTARMLEMVREQIGFQGIELEVRVTGDAGCGCA